MQDLNRIEGVIGHEYFHNWCVPSPPLLLGRAIHVPIPRLAPALGSRSPPAPTPPSPPALSRPRRTGNRVTCRDWFQLTLKEGLTVYRDQQFTADMNSAPVKRIEDVVRLRASQFGEDAGPTSHPIRPDEVGKMDNFYSE